MFFVSTPPSASIELAAIARYITFIDSNGFLDLGTESGALSAAIGKAVRAAVGCDWDTATRNVIGGLARSAHGTLLTAEATPATSWSNMVLRHAMSLTATGCRRIFTKEDLMNLASEIALLDLDNVKAVATPKAAGGGGGRPACRRHKPNGPAYGQTKRQTAR